MFSIFIHSVLFPLEREDLEVLSIFFSPGMTEFELLLMKLLYILIFFLFAKMRQTLLDRAGKERLIVASTVSGYLHSFWPSIFISGLGPD